ncbi:hypothetical protein SLA2020_395490 [Shorea laevis]
MRNSSNSLRHRRGYRYDSGTVAGSRQDDAGIVAGLGELSLLQRTESAERVPDNSPSLDQVTKALRDAGLESSNLILAIDFTKSNEWTGKVSFNGKSLHANGDIKNPYEMAISVIGETLVAFGDDNLIHCFGFGDATTEDQKVFSFHSDHTPCNGLEDVLACYKNMVQIVELAGLTSYGPVIDAAVGIVENSGGQFHVLVIVAAGEVTRSVNIGDKELSSQEERTMKSIVNASSHALSIVLVGVGDGPWEDMKKFVAEIPPRDFDNFQFVNFTEIMSNDKSQSEKEIEFALAALMEIPLQYKATIELGLLGRARKMVILPPPSPHTSRPHGLDDKPSNISSPTVDVRTKACPICLIKVRDMALGCGHLTCSECGRQVDNCPICREVITSRLRVFP